VQFSGTVCGIFDKFPAICSGFFKFAKLCLQYCILACVVMCVYVHACLHIWERELSECNTHRAESTSYNLIPMQKPSWKVSMHNRKWTLLLSNCVRCPFSAVIHKLFSTVDDFGFGDELMGSWTADCSIMTFILCEECVDYVTWKIGPTFCLTVLSLITRLQF